MRNFKFQYLNQTFLIIVICSLFSCAPIIQYLGDSYPATTNIDVYYDENDVERDYTTIGRMTNRKAEGYRIERIQESMIETAKEKGGDAIIFLDSSSHSTLPDDISGIPGNIISVTAKVIRYK